MKEMLLAHIRCVQRDSSGIPTKLYLIPRNPRLDITRGVRGAVVIDPRFGFGRPVLDDQFPQDATDVEWLTRAGARDWVVLSKDERIRRDPFERNAFEQAHVSAFFLTLQGLSGPEMAEIFVRVLPGMARRAGHQPGPFIYTVSRESTFSQLF